MNKPKIFLSGTHGPEFLKLLTDALGTESFNFAYSADFPHEAEFDTVWHDWFVGAIERTSLFVGLYDSSFGRRLWQEYEEAWKRKLPVLAVVFKDSGNPELHYKGRANPELQKFIDTDLRRPSDEAHKVIYADEENAIHFITHEIRHFFNNGGRFAASGEGESNVFVSAEGADSGVTREYAESGGRQDEGGQARRAAEGGGRRGQADGLSEPDSDDAPRSAEAIPPGESGGESVNGLLKQAELALSRGDYAGGRNLLTGSLEISKSFGDLVGVARSLNRLGRLAQAQGEFDEARRLVAESLEISKSIDDRAEVEAALAALRDLEREPQDPTNAAEQEEAAATAGGGEQPGGAAEETGPAELGVSEEYELVFQLAREISDRLGRESIERTVLLASLFASGAEPSARLFLSTFGVEPAALVAPLWRRYGKPPTEADTLDSLLDPNVPRLPFAALVLGPQDRLGAEGILDVVDRALELAHEQDESSIGTRQLLEALLEGPPSAWLASALGEKQVKSAQQVLAERRGQEITPEDVLNEAAKAGVKFKNPAAQSDSVSAVDLLGFDEHAEALADIIRKPETRPPLVVGVYGPWGSGKSTFMKRVKWMLEDGPEKERAEKEQREKNEGQRGSKRVRQWLRRVRAWAVHARRQLGGVWKGLREAVWPPDELPAAPLKIVTVEYDAWAYADTPKLWSGLTAKVARELDAELGWWGRLKYLADKHSRGLFLALLFGLGPVLLFAFAWAAKGLMSFAAAQQVGQWLPPSLRVTGESLSARATSGATTWAGVLVSAAGLVSGYVLQRRPVTDAVTALASRFDASHAAGLVSRIQDEFKTALQTKIAPEEGDPINRRKSTLRQRIERNELKIVVFIDELDRCPLERIVDILEAIKLFLAEDLFIVFLGVDTRVAAEAIRLHYKEVQNPDLPREYLEKIVQLPLRVPTANDKSIRKFLGNFMSIPEQDGGQATQAKASGAKAVAPPVVPHPKAGTVDEQAHAADHGAARVQSSPPGETVTTNYLARPQPAEPTGVGDEKPGRIPDEGTKSQDDTQDITAPPAPAGVATVAASSLSSLPSLPDTSTELARMVELAEKFLEGNPRRIKRLLNTYRYVKILSSVAGQPVADDEWQERMLAWLAFTMRWPAFMERAIESAQSAEAAAKAAAGANGGAAGNGAGAPVPHAGAAQTSWPFLAGLAEGPNEEQEERPTRAQIEAYLPFDAAGVVEHFNLAGNFLVENPRPRPAAKEKRENAPGQNPQHA